MAQHNTLDVCRVDLFTAEYEHVITFYNGSCAIIISQDRPGSSNSLTLSWLLIDEAKFIKTAGVVRRVRAVKNS